MSFGHPTGFHLQPHLRLTQLQVEWVSHLASHLVASYLVPSQTPNFPPVLPLPIQTLSSLLFMFQDKKPKEGRDQHRCVLLSASLPLFINVEISQEQASDDDEEAFFDSETLPTPFGVARAGQLTSPSSSCCPSDRESLAGDYSDREEEGGWGGARTPTFHPPHSPYYCPPSDGDVTPTR